jgi:ABC-type cobalamin/Fe3+-siderophores transport system ATPase subunit
MTIRYRINSLTSSGGDRITLPPTGVTCIVGGNNVGKSQLLSEIARSAQTDEASLARLTISNIEVERPTGTVEETDAWLRERAIEFDMPPGSVSTYAIRLGGTNQTAEELHGWFSSIQGPAYLGNASSFFVHHATAGSLANYAAGHLSGDDFGTLNAPLSKLFRDGDLEDALAQATFDTFGQRLILDRVDVQIALRVGEIQVPVPAINRPTKEYAEAVAALPLLDSQGDGLRSFVGLAVQLLAERPNVFLVDEPEAFLHPGQARAVGRWLGTQSMASDVQLIIATHDRDIVLGLLQCASTVPINIVRVAREGRSTHFAQLDPNEVQAVWDSPVLRYSNVLQGLFHQKVVICESDADCRFFGAALDELAISLGRRSESDDVLFVPAGSKNRVGAMASSLAELNVRAEAIVDFDALRLKADVKGIVIGVGAEWSTEIDELYAKFIKSPNATQSWDVLKKSGLSAMPAGEPYAAAVALIKALQLARVHVISVGEVEDFDKSINLHGAGWVSQALEGRVHVAPPVSEFVEGLLD